MPTTHRHITGDSRQMSLVADESVHLIVTSPPYWQLKDYGSEGQIGFHDSYEAYINNLNLVWKECYRVLHKGCRLCVNIGDQFARSVYYGRYKVIPIRTEIIKCCEELGMDYMGAVIWQKQTTMNTTGGGAVMGSFPYPRNGIMKLDYEFILIFKKLGDAPKPAPEQKQASAMSKEEWNTYFASHWTFGGARQDGHIAMFPEELPARLIKMFTFVGETVLDPFMGSGTTALAARNLGRNSVGYEVNPDFKIYYASKLNVHQLDLDGTTYQFCEDTAAPHTEEAMAALPYTFHDPHKLDKKVDVKKHQFGSKIDKDSRAREDYHRVRQVVSANKMVLDTGTAIRLIGVAPCDGRENDAALYAENMVKGRKVYLRYDTVKYDAQHNLLCYLYLDNRTFVNAHLLRSELIGIDESYDFKYISKFKHIHSSCQTNT